MVCQHPVLTDNIYKIYSLLRLVLLLIYFIPAKVENIVDVLENALFVHVFGCMCMFELAVTGWCIIVT